MKKSNEDLVYTSMSLDKSADDRLIELLNRFKGVGLNKSRIVSIMLKNADDEFFIKCLLNNK